MTDTNDEDDRDGRPCIFGMANCTSRDEGMDLHWAANKRRENSRLAYEAQQKAEAEKAAQAGPVAAAIGSVRQKLKRLRGG